MKRIAIITVMLLMGLSASAHSIRYFTFAQAQRTVSHLNAQQELMLYCGYDYEIETYVLVNEVWMERVNSAYYEIWVYGYDAYTGDEVYMPLDLQCVWLYSAGRMYNAAQYLRFHASVRPPSFGWYVPAYHPFTRRVHAAGYAYSYHYHIHRHGWMPPTPPAHGWGPHVQPPLPPYYMRTPQAPIPTPTNTWTPGVDRPQVNGTTLRNTTGRGSSLPTTRTSESGSTTRTTTGTTERNSGAARSGSATRSNTSGTTTTTSRSTSTTPTRSNTGTTRSTAGSNDNGTATRGTTTTRSNTGTSTRSNTGTSTGTSTRSNTGTSTRSNTGTSTRSDSGTATRSNTGTSTRSNTATPTRSNTGTSASRSSKTNNGTTVRSTSTTTSRSTDASRSNSRTNTTRR